MQLGLLLGILYAIQFFVDSLSDPRITLWRCFAVLISGPVVGTVFGTCFAFYFEGEIDDPKS